MAVRADGECASFSNPGGNWGNEFGVGDEAYVRERSAGCGMAARVVLRRVRVDGLMARVMKRLESMLERRRNGCVSLWCC